MDCQTMQEQASAFIDRELDAEHEANLFAHLAACAPCREFLHRAQSMQADLRREQLLRAPARLDQRVLGNVDRLPARARRVDGWIQRAWQTKLTLPVPVAASIAVFVLAIVLTVLRLPVRNPSGGADGREVVYVMTLPAVEVEAALPAGRSDIR